MEDHDFSHLSTSHLAQLRSSGISDDVILSRGYRTVTNRRDLIDLGFTPAQARVPTVLIPLYGVRGGVVGYQHRPDNPRALKGRVNKYESLPGRPPVLDCQPLVAPQLGDPAKALFITEGVKKADAAASRGLCCIGLQGVWSWRGKNERGGSTALADWEEIALNGRTVYIVFDSDVIQKSEVKAALKRLVAFLQPRGAR